MEYSFDAVLRRLAHVFYSMLPGRFIAAPSLRKIPENLSVPKDGQHIGIFHPYQFVTVRFLEKSLLFEDGIPIRHISDRRAYRNPLYPAYYGLVCIRDIATADDDAIETARHMASVLRATARPHADSLLLIYKITHQPFDVNPPWISGLAQAVASLLCLQLHQLTGTDKYLETSIAFARGMFVPVEKGGPFRKKDGTDPWIEEYPGNPPSYVLNGFLFSLLAVCSLERCADTRFPVSSQDLLRSFYRSYTDYRSGRFLRYSLRDFTMCNAHYCGLHVLLFYQLWLVTGQRQMMTLAKELFPSVNWLLYFRSLGSSLTADRMEWLEKRFR